MEFSMEPAQVFVKYHKLPATTKFHDNPTLLAADPDVDTVMCSPRVDRHTTLLRLVLWAGNQISVE
jgi:hypothetical protein